MAWSTPKTWASGYVVLAADLNTHLRDNLNVTAPAVMTTAGDIIYASGANTPARLAKSTTSTQYLANTGTSNIPAWNEVALDTGVSGLLPHENGGLEFDASAITTGGTVVGQSSGVMGIETPMTQAQAEAGTDTQVRGVTAQRIGQAITGQGTAAKVWVQIPANGIITPSAANSLNVTSVTDSGTGDRTIVIADDFDNETYAALANLSEHRSALFGVMAHTRAVGSCDVDIYDTSDTHSDQEVAVVMFGVLA